MIENSEKTTDLGKRLEILFDEITFSVFKNVSRGLFEKHKIVYSFMINAALLLNEGLLRSSQWNFLLRGSDQIAEVKHIF